VCRYIDFEDRWDSGLGRAIFKTDYDKKCNKNKYVYKSLKTIKYASQVYHLAGE
jgi:hypothetical protein